MDTWIALRGGLEGSGAAIWLSALAGAIVALALLWLRTSRRTRDAVRQPEDVIVIPEAELPGDDPSVRTVAIAARIGQPGVDAIVAGALRDDSPGVRRRAVLALAEIGDFRAAHAVSEVVRSDPSAEVREEAVVAIARMLERRLAGRLVESRP